MSEESKKAYIEKLEAKLKGWTSEYERVKEKMGSSEARIKEEYHKKMEYLHDRSEEIKKKIQALKASSGETWDELRYATEDIWEDMKTAIEKITSKIRHGK